MDKPDCYECRHRKKLSGDEHSCCEHPEPKTLQVKGHPHGVAKGWFMWPFNYDPTWLLECNGFDEKDVIDNPDTERKSPTGREAE